MLLILRVVEVVVFDRRCLECFGDLCVSASFPGFGTDFGLYPPGGILVLCLTRTPLSMGWSACQYDNILRISRYECKGVIIPAVLALLIA